MAKNNQTSQKIVIGNWKMHPATLLEAKHIIAKTKKAAGNLNHTSVVICPPFPFISYALPRAGGPKKNSDVSVGAQNAFFEEQGAFTGEVSAWALADMGVDYVILGHSERRHPKEPLVSGGISGESDILVAKKAVAVAAAGMTAVICVGEEVRDAQGAYLDMLREQIKASLQGFPKKAVKKLIVAYEPVWAIGAKEAMTPALVREMNLFVKKVLSDMYGQEEAVAVPILYGGSVNFRNAADILREGEVDGFLVGRESVNAPGFAELLKAVDTATGV